jgi:hypothetical protein
LQALLFIPDASTPTNTNSWMWPSSGVRSGRRKPEKMFANRIRSDYLLPLRRYDMITPETRLHFGASPS